MEINEVQRELNEIAFVGCPRIKVGDVLHYELEKQTSETIIALILKMIKLACTASSYEFQQYGDPRAIMLFSNDCKGRADHLTAFNNVLEVVNDAVAVRPYKRQYSLSGIGRAVLPIKWTRQMRKAVPSLRKRLEYSSIVFKAYIDDSEIFLKINNNNWDRLPFITYCDVMSVDSFVIQHFNNLGNMTVTLQHGSFDINSNSWAYVGSHSKVFLAENQCAVDDAKSLGCMGNIIPVGSPHNLSARKAHKTDVQARGINIESIGVVMNSPIKEMEDNVQMISVVQEYCKKNSIKLLLKYHPADRLDKYKMLIDENITAVCDKGVSIEDFAERVDFVVVSSSTAFLTVLNMGVPAYLFVRPGHDPKLYSHTDMLKFSTPNELDRLVDLRKSEKFEHELNHIKKYLLSPCEIHECYQKAFKSIGIL